MKLSELSEFGSPSYFDLSGDLSGIPHISTIMLCRKILTKTQNRHEGILKLPKVLITFALSLSNPLLQIANKNNELSHWTSCSVFVFIVNWKGTDRFCRLNMQEWHMTGYNQVSSHSLQWSTDHSHTFINIRYWVTLFMLISVSPSYSLQQTWPVLTCKFALVKSAVLVIFSYTDEIAWENHQQWSFIYL